MKTKLLLMFALLLWGSDGFIQAQGTIGYLAGQVAYATDGAVLSVDRESTTVLASYELTENEIMLSISSAIAGDLMADIPARWREAGEGHGRHMILTFTYDKQDYIATIFDKKYIRVRVFK